MAASFHAAANRRSVLQRLWRSFVPDADSVAPEYWQKRTLEILIKFFGVIKSLLVAQGILFAAGVGNENSTPLTYILITEISDVTSRILGLVLSKLVKVDFFASESKRYTFLNIILKTIPETLSLLICYFPEKLHILVFMETVFGSLLSVMSTPADSANWSHYIRSKTPRKRAHVHQINSNQDSLCSYAFLMVRVFFLFRVIDYISPQQLFYLWFFVCAIQSALQVLLLSAAVIPIFNVERLSLAYSGLEIKQSCRFPSPKEISIKEQWYHVRGLIKQRKVRLAVEGNDFLKNISSKGEFIRLLEIHEKENYLINVEDKNLARISIMMKTKSSSEDVIKAVCHGLRTLKLLEIGKDKSEKDVLDMIDKSKLREDEWDFFKTVTRNQGWKISQHLCFCETDWRFSYGDTDSLFITQHRVRYNGSIEKLDVSNPTLSQSACNHECLKVEDKNNRRISIWEETASLMLPNGYPLTVPSEYLRYQVWDTLQVLVSDLRGIIIQQARLTAVGIGVPDATPKGTLAVELMVEFVGNSSSLIIGSFFDCGASATNVQSWRLYKSLSSFVSSFLSLIQGLYPGSRTLYACVDTIVVKSISNYARGADQALILHLSKNSLDASLVADVAAKEKNQDYLLGLVLLLPRYFLVWWVGLDFLKASRIVIFLSFTHLIFSYLSVNTLKLNLKAD